MEEDRKGSFYKINKPEIAIVLSKSYQILQNKTIGGYNHVELLRPLIMVYMHNDTHDLHGYMWYNLRFYKFDGQNIY